MTGVPLGIRAYRLFTLVISPAAPLLLRRRGIRGKEDAKRATERLGVASVPRPDGKLLWIHGASNGECLAALPLIDAFVSRGMKVLVTSGTVTSAELMGTQLPRGAVHQFVPLDTPSATARFLDNWKPDVGLFIDSDLWPNLILAARKRGTRLALINARISQRSFEGWRWARKTVTTVLAAFDVCLAQDEEIATRFRLLGAANVRVVGSIKEDAPPLAFDKAKLSELKVSTDGRPILLAAQTHPGEDETILPVHDALRLKFPEILTIIVPRHPARGAELVQLCGARTCQRRSEGGQIRRDTAVYVADTMGELGLFYRIAPFAFIGGTLVPKGGHNPLEAARLHCGVMAGPHTFNSQTAFDAVLGAQKMGRVANSVEITVLAEQLLSDPAKAKAMGDAAAAGAATLGGAVEKTIEAVDGLLGSHAPA